MKTLNSRGSALVSAATLALVLSFSAIADQAKEQSKATKKIKSSQQVMVNTINLNLTTQQGNFAAAREKGLTMLGYKDVQGLKRIIGSILKDTAKSNSELSAALEKAAGNNGVDADAIKEMSGLLRGGFGPIDRIEFVPGWDGADESGRIVDPLNDDMSYAPSDYGPSWPSAGSLVGYITSDSTSQDRGGFIRRITFSDGSWLTYGSYADKDDNKVTHFTATGQNGQGVVVDEQRVTDPEGTPRHRHTRNRPHPENESEAGNWYNKYRLLQEEARREREAQESTPASEKPEATDKPVTSEKPEKPAIDKYQPSEGEPGTYCPMTLDICRRELDRALKSGEQVLAGMVFVNPGDPDVQPDAPRLIYDPEDLVTNPAISAAARKSTFTAGRYRMALPVLVLPPRPNS
jgi:hypothetical protein